MQPKLTSREEPPQDPLTWSSGQRVSRDISQPSVKGEENWGGMALRSLSSSHSSLADVGLPGCQTRAWTGDQLNIALSPTGNLQQVSATHLPLPLSSAVGVWVNRAGRGVGERGIVLCGLIERMLSPDLRSDTFSSLSSCLPPGNLSMSGYTYLGGGGDGRDPSLL